MSNYLTIHVTRTGQLGLDIGAEGNWYLTWNSDFFFWLELLICYKLSIEGYCVKAIIVSRSELLLFAVSMWEREGWRLQTAHLIQLLLSQLGTQRDNSVSMLGTTPRK